MARNQYGLVLLLLIGVELDARFSIWVFFANKRLEIWNSIHLKHFSLILFEAKLKI